MNGVGIENHLGRVFNGQAEMVVFDVIAQQDNPRLMPEIEGFVPESFQQVLPQNQQGLVGFNPVRGWISRGLGKPVVLDQAAYVVQVQITGGVVHKCVVSQLDIPVADFEPANRPGVRKRGITDLNIRMVEGHSPLQAQSPEPGPSRAGKG